MTVPPESLDTAAPRDPAAYRAPRLMGRGFWAMIALSVFCVIGGATVATIGPRLLKPQPSPAADVQPVADPLPVAPRAPAAPASDVLVPEPAVEPPPGAELGRLEERLSALEGRQAQVAEAAGSALAAVALAEASQGSRPFPDELRALEAVAPPSAELRALRRPAELGAPSRAVLAANFPEYAARAVAAGRTPGEGAGFFAWASYAVSRVVALRRVGETSGGGVDAVLARSEQLVEDGDLDQALRTLETLPAKARESIAPWRVRAERRAEIDARVSAVRLEALETLARASREPGT